MKSGPLLLLLALVAAIALGGGAFAFAGGDAGMPEPLTPLGRRFTGGPAKDDLPEWEQSKILDAADRFGIDPTFLAAIRLQEQGPRLTDGHTGFGVLPMSSAPTYDAQLETAARSVKAALARYARGEPNFIGGPLPGAPGARDFLEYFAGRWAPLGAANDPTGLNQHWLSGVRGFFNASTAA